MAALTYRNSDDERADKAQQERLLAVLSAWRQAFAFARLVRFGVAAAVACSAAAG